MTNLEARRLRREPPPVEIKCQIGDLLAAASEFKYLHHTLARIAIREYCKYVILLKPQDVVVLLKLALQNQSSTLSALGAQLGISASEVHGAMNRASSATLLDLDQRRPRVRNLLEFLEHGIRYVFVSRRGEITRGVPTAFSAPPLSDRLWRPLPEFDNILTRAAANAAGVPQVTAPAVPLVWPHPEGEVRGEGFEPLYPSVVDAARKDVKLYECLALVDAVRVGGAREKKLAIDLLTERLRPQ
jgi:hypothetical protein